MENLDESGYTANDICGIWLMVSCVGESEDGARFLPYGEMPLGQLVYDASGRMSVFLMNAERRHFANEDISAASADEICSAFTSFDAYAGKWYFENDNKTVVHEIEFARIPNWIGCRHQREICLLEDNLVLRTEPFKMGTKVWRVTVLWEREP